MTYQIYTDARGEYRWRLKAANGNILADSGEGYTTKANCQNGINSVKASSGSPIVEV